MSKRFFVVLTAVLLTAVSTGQASAAPVVEVVDLGTLPGETTSEAVDVNATGMVAGRSGWRAVRWDEQGVITDLGTAGGVTSEAVDINNHGEVAGTLSLGNGQRHAVRWSVRNDGLDLGTLPGGAESWAYAINDQSVVVGAAYAPIPGGFAQHPVRWDRSGRITDLGAAGGWGAAYAINNDGTVVGEAGGHAARWDASGKLTVLNRLPGSVLSVATRISEVGVAVGHAVTADGQDHAVRWDQWGRITDLGTLPSARYSRGFAINDSGTVAGASAVTGELFPQHAARWDRLGRIADLGSLPGSDYAAATDINRYGVIIGHSGFSAVWWNRSGQLSQLIGLEGDAASHAAAINDNNIAVGTSRSHATLWHLPTP